MAEKSFILSGPTDPEIPNEPIGKYLIGCLRKRNKEDVASIDAVTGRAQTCGGLLEDIIKAVQVLKDLGVRKGDVIALICENMVGYNVPLVAALCMGVVTMLLNPEYTTGELRHALLISKPKVILCSSKAIRNTLILKKELDFIQTVIIIGDVDDYAAKSLVNTFENLIKSMNNFNFADFEPDSFETDGQGVVILMSSGTTGLPKGVLITQQAMMIALNYMGDQRCLAIEPGSSIILVVPVFHVVGMIACLTPLSLKTAVIVLQKFHVGAFLKAIEQYKVRKLQIVPPLLSIFANCNSDYDLSTVEEILVGGAPLSNEAVCEVAQRMPNVKFRELYGSTEVTGTCTILQTFPKKTNCIGLLTPHLQAKVCDTDSGNALGFMEIGELCFKGPMVMNGYVGIPNTTNIIDEDGFYHSGDVGYYDEEGVFYIVERMKELIKYKAFQVSPTELECLLSTNTYVKDCAVIGIPDKRAGQLPLACVVRQPNSHVTEQEIVDFVAENISVQKRLYGGVRFMEEIPRNSLGKILRRKLEEFIKVDNV